MITLPSDEEGDSGRQELYSDCKLFHPGENAEAVSLPQLSFEKDNKSHFLANLMTYCNANEPHKIREQK